MPTVKSIKKQLKRLSLEQSIQDYVVTLQQKWLGKCSLILSVAFDCVSRNVTAVSVLYGSEQLLKRRWYSVL